MSLHSGRKYLESLPYIECTFESSTYLTLFLLAIVFLFVYPIGVTVLLSWLLYRYGSAENTHDSITGFLSEGYRHSLYAFEV